MVSGEFIIPNEYDVPNVNNDVPAQYCETPEHVGRDLEDIDLNQYWNQAIQDGMGPGPENNVEQPPEPEFADNCDPPEIELSKNTDIGEDLNDTLSARDRIIMAGRDGLTSPSDAANIAATIHAPSGAEDTYAQLTQAAWNTGVVGSQEYMDATIRQHGKNPATELNNMQIQQEIENASEYQGKPLNEQSYYDENGKDITHENIRE